jgi:hydrophobic/amphiphilic exporter-1 (mainly G- bacteria), HAE1 family
MSLTKLALQRPLTMLMILLSLLIMGYQGYNRLLLDSFPKVDFPFVTISVFFPGASPEDVEELVIKPIEDAVATISGIDELNSTAVEGVGNVTIAFVEGTDGNRAAIDVERQVATVRGQLPDEAEDPTIIKIDINAIPVMIMSLSGPQNQDDLFELANDEIKTRLQAVPGVASVGVTGGREREIQVLIDPAKLAAFGIPLGDVQRKLAENNITFPAGSIEEGRQKISVRSVGEFTSLAEVENLVIRESGSGPSGSGGGGRVFLRDVATVSEGFADRSSILRYNGRDSVSISVVKASDANTVQTVDEIKDSIEELNELLPRGAQLITILDNSEFIRQSVAAVIEDLLLAILITGAVILVFLHNVRSTFIVILAVPTCIIYTFLVMWILDFSLNQLTLLALTLVIGILVDDAIVVIENIERHLHMGKPPMQAALDGRTEIGFAALTITLVDVVVYVPVAFTSGIIGQFFFSYGITVAVATLFSLFVAFTLTPMLAGLWLEDRSKPQSRPRGLRRLFYYLFLPVSWIWQGFIYLFEKAFNLLTIIYGAVLRFFLWNFATQLLAVLLAVGALAGGIYMVIGGFVGSEFLPQTDDGQIRITVEMPAGTNLEATDQVVRQLETLIISNVPETSAVLAQVGAGGGGNPFEGGGSQSANTATVNVILVDKADRTRSTIEVVEALRPLTQRIPEAVVALSLNSGGGGGGASPIEVRLHGTDTNVLIDLAEKVEATIKAVPGTADVKNTGAARSPENRLLVNRDLALDLDLSPSQVATTLRTALSGSPVGKYQPPDGSNEIDITLRLAESSRQNLNQLLQTPVKYINNQPVTLDRVVSLERDQAPARISRSNRQRILTVGTGIAAGTTVGEVTDAVEAAIQENVEFPTGYGFEFVGASESQRESFAQLGQSILLGIILIYMLLVALYQSWLQPLAIMFSLPVTLVGAIGGLYLTGNTLNIISLMGVILLTGVVTKNAILIVDFTNNLRENEGYSRKDALVAAGRLRLRAILMTTMALCFALLPLLLGAGAGSEGRAPLAAVVIGGNLSSTLLTLILVPVVYNFFDWGGGLVSRGFKKLLGTDQEEERVLVEPEETEGEPKPASPRHPSPQAGSALSLNPPTRAE